MFREFVGPIMFMLVVILGVSAGATVLHHHQFTADCEARGGTVSTEGFTSTCSWGQR